MFIPRLYYPHAIQCGDVIPFDKEKSHYVSTVLRLKEGEPLILFNGQQGEYHASILCEKKRFFAKVLTYKDMQRESFLPIHLGQGLARGDRMDIIIQKASELGVTSITPLYTQQSAVKLDAQRAHKRLEHWQNIAISACEQCGRTKIPSIVAPMLLTQWVAQPFAGTSLLFAPAAAHSVKNLAAPQAIRLAIGPESGWNEKEIALMQNHQFIQTTLGPRILRTETASIAALSIIQGLFGDLT